jgi:hypothetical protein
MEWAGMDAATFSRLRKESADTRGHFAFWT